MTITVTGEQARATLDAIGNEFPERVITVCQYQSMGEPVCLVGVALNRLGVDVNTLREMDSDFGGFGAHEYDDPYYDGSDITGHDKLVDIAGVDLEEDAWEVFRMAQELQDAQIPWGNAVTTALEY